MYVLFSEGREELRSLAGPGNQIGVYCTYLIGGEEIGVLGGESVERDGGLVADVELEVLERFWEEVHVAVLQRGRVQDVVVADGARVDAALHHEQRLGGVRVGVDGHHAADVILASKHRDLL